MKYLGIDFGLSKVGLAVSEGKLAEPLRVIRYGDLESLVKSLESLIPELGIQNIILGISDGKMESKTKEFGNVLEKETGITIIYQDETLSTLEANSFATEAGMSRKKRKGLEDAFAATLILQSYLDSMKISAN